MNDAMQVDLLGYLLGALDEAERERTEEALRRQPALQRDLAALQARLAGLEALRADHEPPPGLAERTCRMIDEWRQNSPLPQPAPRRAPGWLRHRWGRMAARIEHAVAPGGLSFVDGFVVAGILLVLAFLFFPALSHSRFQSQVVACQYNLQQVGQSLLSYADKRDGCFPVVPTHGNRAAAGVYAVVLDEEGYLVNRYWLICPSSPLVRRLDTWRVPSMAELDQASGPELTRLHRTMGGSYGYSLSYLLDGVYRPLRIEGGGLLALMADAPSRSLPGHQSGNHGGLGQNVLFADGRVVFLADCEALRGGDALFLNRPGYAEAGVDPYDSVIGDSGTAPFIRQ